MEKLERTKSQGNFNRLSFLSCQPSCLGCSLLVSMQVAPPILTQGDERASPPHSWEALCLCKALNQEANAQIAS